VATGYASVVATWPAAADMARPGRSSAGTKVSAVNATAHQNVWPIDDQDELFETGLEWLLDGIARGAA
jgi:hypothetical protein